MEGAAFRRLMGSWTTGVSVISAAGHDGAAGVTANALASLSLEPQLVLVCFDLTSRTLTAVREANRLCINMLAADQEEISRTFATKASHEEKFVEVSHRIEHGTPVLDGCLAWLVCDVASEFRQGDHVVVIGNVVDGAVDSEAEPLLYYRGAYGRLARDSRPVDAAR